MTEAIKPFKRYEPVESRYTITNSVTGMSDAKYLVKRGKYGKLCNCELKC